MVLGAGKISLIHSQSFESLLKNCDSSFEIYLWEFYKPLQIQGKGHWREQALPLRLSQAIG